MAITHAPRAHRPRKAPSSPAPTADVWQQLARDADPLKRTPAPDPLVLAVALETARGDHYYMLKHPDRGLYYRLSPVDHEVWKLIDGQRTIDQIVVETFKLTGSLDLGRVVTLVGNLQARGFLLGPRTNVWETIAARLHRPTPKDVVSKAWNVFMQFEIPVNGLDGILTAVHRWGGFLIFTPVAVALWSLLAVAGIVMTVLSLVTQRAAGPATFPVGLLGLVLLAITFIHEFAHAITCKHAGADVRSGGVMLFMGLPAFFINTTDIWTKRRRSRVAVSWAGPWSTLVCGGLMATYAFFVPESPLARMFVIAGLLCMVLTIVNLNPLSETDGYYMLIDWLEFPLLRERALTFLKHDLRARWKEHTKLQGDERLFAWFGVGSFIWTVVGVFMGLYFWKARVSKLLITAWAGMATWQRGVVVVFVLIFTVPLALGLYGVVLQPVVDRLLKPLLARFRTADPKKEVLEQRMAALGGLPFLQEVDHNELAWIAGKLHRKDHTPGEQIIRQGAPGDKFYLLEKGLVDVVVVDHLGQRRQLAQLGPGSYFGETALLHDVPRTASVNAVTPVTTLALSRQDFHALVGDRAALISQAAEAINDRQELARHPFFQPLPPELLDEILPRLSVRHLDPGEVLAWEGYPAEAFWIVASGELGLYRWNAETEQQVETGVVGYGAFFGETALIAETPLTDTAMARGETMLYTLDRDAFLAVVGRLAMVLGEVRPVTSQRGRHGRQTDVWGAPAAA